MAQRKIDQGFIFAAGFGQRMRPLTDDKPKPMVSVDGKPMIDHILDDFQNFGISNAVVNSHYKAEILHQHLKSRTQPFVTISHEPELLHTGGGLKHALSHFNGRDFFASNGDSYLESGVNKTPLERMQDTWNSDIMDILILLQPVESMHLTEGVGDYDLDDNGRATRNLNKSGEYMFTSLRINASRIFDNSPDEPFNYRDLMDKAQDEGRLYGLVHDGLWHHISTPADVETVNAHLMQKRKHAS